jgi:hypothetical protein
MAVASEAIMLFVVLGVGYCVFVFSRPHTARAEA